MYSEYQQFLTPIKPDPPAPHHTELKPRCITCKHFEVCNIKRDYLKTATLIQNVLGNPCESYMINMPCCNIKDFCGTLVVNYEEYFPTEVTTTLDKTGKFYAARYKNSEEISFIYIVDEYYVLFNAKYNVETEVFDIEVRREIKYGLSCTLSDEDIETLKLNLEILQEDINKKEAEKEEKDIINTTYFSAALDCSYYDWIKGLSYEDGIKRLISKYPCGIPIGEDEVYHLATFHCENGKVPYYHPENGVPVLAPMPYPVFFPAKSHHCKKRPPRTREELNEF